MPILLPGESLGQRSLADYSPRGRGAGHDWATDAHDVGTLYARVWWTVWLSVESWGRNHFPAEFGRRRSVDFQCQGGGRCAQSHAFACDLCLPLRKSCRLLLAFADGMAAVPRRGLRVGHYAGNQGDLFRLWTPVLQPDCPSGLLFSHSFVFCFPTGEISPTSLKPSLNFVLPWLFQFQEPFKVPENIKKNKNTIFPCFKDGGQGFHYTLHPGGKVCLFMAFQLDYLIKPKGSESSFITLL